MHLTRGGVCGCQEVPFYKEKLVEVPTYITKEIEKIVEVTKQVA